MLCQQTVTRQRSIKQPLHLRKLPRGTVGGQNDQTVLPGAAHLQRGRVGPLLQRGGQRLGQNAGGGTDDVLPFGGLTGVPAYRQPQPYGAVRGRAPGIQRPDHTPAPAACSAACCASCRR